MPSDADDFKNHAKALLAIAEQLSKTGGAIYKHEYLSVGFGRWSIVAGTADDRFQFTWEGRECMLAIAQAVSDGSPQRSWKTLRTINARHADALTQIERFLQEKFG